MESFLPSETNKFTKEFGHDVFGYQKHSKKPFENKDFAQKHKEHMIHENVRFFGPEAKRLRPFEQISLFGTINTRKKHRPLLNVKLLFDQEQRKTMKQIEHDVLVWTETHNKQLSPFEHEVFFRSERQTHVRNDLDMLPLWTRCTTAQERPAKEKGKNWAETHSNKIMWTCPICGAETIETIWTVFLFGDPKDTKEAPESFEHQAFSSIRNTKKV